MIPTSPDRPSELRRLLIDAARRILDDPETPLDLRKVAEAAGKSRTAPYLVFGKEKEGGGIAALRMAVAADGARELARRMKATSESTEDPRLAFSRLAEALFSFATENPRLFRLMFGPEIGAIPNTPAPAEQRHPEFENLVDARRSAEEVLADVISRGQASRMLPGGDRLQLTMGAWALLIGTAVLLLDRVLEAADIHTSAEGAAELATGMLLGPAAEPVTRAALALLAAEEKKETAYLRDSTNVSGAFVAADPTRDVMPPQTGIVADRAGESTGIRERRAGWEGPPALHSRATWAIANYSSLRRAALVATALSGARVLWIDDEPDGNRWERETLETFGVQVETATSTGAGLEWLSEQEFDLILSDIARDGKSDEGIAALTRLQGIAPDTPVIFYVGRVDPTRGTPPGAAGLTDRPDELLHLVLDALERRRL